MATSQSSSSSSPSNSTSISLVPFYHPARPRNLRPIKNGSTALPNAFNVPSYSMRRTPTPTASPRSSTDSELFVVDVGEDARSSHSTPVQAVIDNGLHSQKSRTRLSRPPLRTISSLPAAANQSTNQVQDVKSNEKRRSIKAKFREHLSIQFGGYAFPFVAPVQVKEEKENFGIIEPFPLPTPSIASPISASSPSQAKQYPHSTNYTSSFSDSSASESNRNSLSTQHSHVLVQSPPLRPRAPTPLSFPDNSLATTMVDDFEEVTPNPMGRHAAMLAPMKVERPLTKFEKDRAEGWIPDVAEMARKAREQGWRPPIEWEVGFHPATASAGVRRRPASGRDLEKGLPEGVYEVAYRSEELGGKRRTDAERRRRRTNWFLGTLATLITLYLLVNNIFLDVRFASLSSPSPSEESVKTTSTYALACLSLFPLLPPANYPCSQCLPFLSSSDSTVTDSLKGLENNVTEIESFCSLKTIVDSSTSTATALKAQGWMENSDFCSWSGVTCASDKPLRVNKLTLNKLSLDSPFLLSAISTSTSLASSLQSLDLSSNKLTGPIPTFRDFKLLATVDLRNNSLSGMVGDVREGVTILTDD
ncbi:hypothetical protein BT69DRAFT_1321447 [Atractiella rhizophila]|nr:hypothetical protein BT69DRAFT_1321447 [Atractiella rhizophila]